MTPSNLANPHTWTQVGKICGTLHVCVQLPSLCRITWFFKIQRWLHPQIHRMLEWTEKWWLSVLEHQYYRMIKKNEVRNWTYKLLNTLWIPFFFFWGDVGWLGKGGGGVISLKSLNMFIQEFWRLFSKMARVFSILLMSTYFSDICSRTGGVVHEKGLLPQARKWANLFSFLS